jgi:ferredoxin--NADP+ reductase
VSERVAIVGAGPAGFYTAELLLAQSVEVDMFDRLPTPFGLVRAGVAPDHPKIKSVTRIYEKTAHRGGFRFFGGVEVGQDIAPSDLRARYHAVVFAIGTSAERRLGIRGETLEGSHAAGEFVGWYNGHPDFSDESYDLTCSRAVVIGNGNVALDVARMLMLSEEELAATDTADHALEGLRCSSIREVVVLGRRGPLQAAFTNPELRELGNLAQAEIVVDPDQVLGDELDPEQLEARQVDKTARRNVGILREYATRASGQAARRMVLRFLSSPMEVLGSDEGRVTGLRVARTRIVTHSADGPVAEPTGEEEILECGLLIAAVGYRGQALPGIPFHQSRGVIPNRQGRVVDAGQIRDGEYVAGWIKRGPSGVIGTNKKDAAETVDRIIEDLAAGRLAQPELEADETWISSKAPFAVGWAGWQAIDRHECNAGKPYGRPRIKLVRLAQLAQVAAANRHYEERKAM